LFPVAQRLGPGLVAAMFGRKVAGRRRWRWGPALPTAPRFSARLSGSYERPAWKRLLRGQLLQSRVDAAEPGRVAMEIATRTGPGRNWANLWKPLIDAFGLAATGRTFGSRSSTPSAGSCAKTQHSHSIRTMTASSASACATTSLTTRPRGDHRRMVDQPVARRPRALGELWLPDRWAALRSVSSNLLLTCPAGQAPVRLDMAPPGRRGRPFRIEENILLPRRVGAPSAWHLTACANGWPWSCERRR